MCRDCAGDEQGRNDFVHSGGLWWALCEGCGYHGFGLNGARLCGRPQSDFDNPTDEPDSYRDWCGACREVAGMGLVDQP